MSAYVVSKTIGYMSKLKHYSKWDQNNKTPVQDWQASEYKGSLEVMLGIRSSVWVGSSQEALCAHNQWTHCPGAGGEPALVSKQWSLHCRVICSITNTQAWLKDLITRRGLSDHKWKIAGRNADTQGQLDALLSNLKFLGGVWKRRFLCICINGNKQLCLNTIHVAKFFLTQNRLSLSIFGASAISLETSQQICCGNDNIRKIQQTHWPFHIVLNVTGKCIYKL